MDAWGRIDVLVNSAGHGPKGDILEISDDDWHMGMEVYLMNVIRPTRLVAPIMAEQGGGTILNISTFAVFEPDPTPFGQDTYVEVAARFELDGPFWGAPFPGGTLARQSSSNTTSPTVSRWLRTRCARIAAHQRA